MENSAISEAATGAVEIFFLGAARFVWKFSVDSSLAEEIFVEQ